MGASFGTTCRQHNWFVRACRSQRVGCRGQLEIALGGLLAIWLTVVAGAAPPYQIKQSPKLCYVAKATWFDTMLASRAALQAEEAAGRRPPLQVAFHSEVVHGRAPARPITVPLHGVPEVYFYVTGGPDVVYAAGDWLAPTAVDANGQRTLLCTNKRLEIQQGFHTVDCSLRSRVDPPLRVADESFEHGINLQAPGKIRVELPPDAVSLEAKIGIDDWVNPESYKLPQPFYYQPQHFSTAAALKRNPKDRTPAQPHGAARFHVTDAAGAARIDLWTRLAEEFSHDLPRRQMRWEREDQILENDWPLGGWQNLAKRYVVACWRVPSLQAAAQRLAARISDRAGLERIRAIYHRSRQLAEALQRAERLDTSPLRDAINDLIAEYGNAYPQGPDFLARLQRLESELSVAVKTCQAAERRNATGQRDNAIVHRRLLERLVQYDALQKAALTANPLLDFDRILVVRRTPHGDPRRAIGRGYGVAEYLGYPRQSSKCNPGIEQPLNWDNDLCIVSPVTGDGAIRSIYQPSDRRLLKDVDLHWDAQRLLFSMPGSHNKWHVFEMNLDGSDVHQLTPTDQPDIDFYDACYLPSDEIALVSTAPLQGVPCNAGVIVGMMFKMNADGSGIHQIAFEQDHTYCPSVTEDGRLLYLRWDYTDTPHVWNRILFTMNPDGTGQSEFYGSNSYWPNSLFFARTIPNQPTKFVGIVTGHHVGRAGEMMLFDVARGRSETTGVVQRIGDRHGRVEPTIEDKLTQHSWPKFLNPYPLSDKYFLVSCKPTPNSLWGIYLVDVFDNMVLLKEEEERALFEPIPIRRRPRPPVIPDRTRPESAYGTVYLADIYAGPGLQGIPRGTVKKLRLFTYHFAYQKQAGIEDRVGTDGPWEVKRVLGTVPVEADGSALFRVPAKTPLSLQPLDAEGNALQLMRSWMTVMPGERRSCVGCHENTGSTPPSFVGSTLAESKPVARIQPWYGPPRGFSFQREVQPVLDKYCVSCHDGAPGPAGKPVVDLRANQPAIWVYQHGRPELLRFENTPMKELAKKYSGLFPPSYIELRKHVRVGGLESDLHLLPPMEFHADTSRLTQILKKGHYGVKLNAEAWDRMITWIDLNAPCHGTWHEFTRIPNDQDKRRCVLRAMYGGKQEDGEQIVHGDSPFAGDMTPVIPAAPSDKSAAVATGTSGVLVSAAICPDSPSQAGVDDARRGVQPNSTERGLTLDLGDGVTMQCAEIPACGGSTDAHGGNSIWMGSYEITNRQYAQFDPQHESRFEDRGSWIFSEEYLGWPLDAPDQPVVRVSWQEARRFCSMLSQRTGRTVRLPTEQEWERACRAGSATPFWYGDMTTDYAPYANLGDQSLRRLATESWGPKPPDVVARDDRFNDGFLVTAKVGSFAPNRFGLYDMHGNVAEWTASRYERRPGTMVVRGGSWRDLPRDATSTARWGYYPYEKVFNVGFRVVVE